MSFFSPDPQTSELEHILAHTHGAYESRIARRHNFELELLFGRFEILRGEDSGSAFNDYSVLFVLMSA
ncbi:predicted protein [Sclerotinia sclerotiorum 1980 UF-70]|uniref:Uncharacterized protein n=1 Tax=Sclerotinia sclerotiorum (strain ATCC 18683 / 1980 / Ss-1) TaxID=665079 RepID=A7EVK2_SCLS1|nr:predicted protein [Sclerotinia sclerotiorum 1980 UF-70]EDN93494.1 predicted protein [Sclerotinia sclerotiorum 1980 UF-70]